MLRFSWALTLLCVGLLGCAVLERAAPRGAPAPPRIYRIGFLGGGSPQPWQEELVRGLARRGYVIGENLSIEYRYADVQQEPLPVLAEELVKLGVEVIVTTDTPATLAARSASSRIPIVVAVAGDPVQTGLASSQSRPGGNVTGLASRWPELSGKRLELLAELIPRLSRVAVLFEPDNPSHKQDFADTVAAGPTLRVDIAEVHYRDTCDLPTSFDEALGIGADAAVFLVTPRVARDRAWITKLAADRGLPVMYGRDEFVAAGGLMSYTVSLGALYGRSAEFVDRILKGAYPADMPFEQPNPSDLELAVNPEAAKAVGRELPLALLRRADRVLSGSPAEPVTSPCAMS